MPVGSSVTSMPAPRNPRTKRDSKSLKEGKRLYDVMFEARLEVEKYRGMKWNAPKKQREALGNAIMALRNADTKLAEFMKHMDIVDYSKLHVYGRRKQGLPT